MHYRPIAPRPAASTGFGFEDVMARPFEDRFRRWYDAASRLPAMPIRRTD